MPSQAHSLYRVTSAASSTPEVAARQASCAQAIQEALELCLERDPTTLLIGEGVPDPKAIFGTTAGLRERFGTQRVFDMPLAENGMTGICIGAALTGMRPIMVHQRIDFALLAMDQLINNAAKWHYMFAGQGSVPLVVRAIVGRGWGQGPQHAQSLQATFAHVPGLKVVMPVFPDDAKGMLCRAVQDDNPVLFIEHRWIHQVKGVVPAGYFERDLNGAVVRQTGRHVTVAAFSYMVIEALHAARVLAKLGVELEVIDMRSVSPLDTATVLSSVNKTGRLIVADTGHESFGAAAELISRVAEQGFTTLRRAPVRIATPDIPTPTTHAWAADYYPGGREIAVQALRLSEMDTNETVEAALGALASDLSPDVPNPDYHGPF